MAATISLSLASIAETTSGRCGGCGGLPNSLISAPAMKVRPAQSSTPASSVASAFSAVTTSTRPARMACDSALTGGLSMRMRPIGPRRASVTGCFTRAILLTMKLYTYFRSSAAFRVRIALNLKGLEYQAISTDLRAQAGEHRRPDYLALNPQGLVPALEDEGRVLGQSIAIIEYLEEKFPAPPLLPKAPLDRATVRAMALGIACDMHPLNNLRVLNYLRDELKHSEDEVNRWYAHWIAAGFRGLEELARRSTVDGRHCFGSAVTLADVCLVPQMYNARRFKCEVTPYPTLVSICSHLEQLPAFSAAR